MELWEFHSFTASSIPKKNAGKGRLSSGFPASFERYFLPSGAFAVTFRVVNIQQCKGFCLPLVQLVMFLAMSEKKTCLPDLLTLKVV